jgi:hypothetical protein
MHHASSIIASPITGRTSTVSRTRVHARLHATSFFTHIFIFSRRRIDRRGG